MLFKDIWPYCLSFLHNKYKYLNFYFILVSEFFNNVTLLLVYLHLLNWSISVIRDLISPVTAISIAHGVPAAHWAIKFSKWMTNNFLEKKSLIFYCGLRKIQQNTGYHVTHLQIRKPPCLMKEEIIFSLEDKKRCLGEEMNVSAFK